VSVTRRLIATVFRHFGRIEGRAYIRFFKSEAVRRRQCYCLVDQCFVDPYQFSFSVLEVLYGNYSRCSHAVTLALSVYWWILHQFSLFLILEAPFTATTDGASHAVTLALSVSQFQFS